MKNRVYACIDLKSFYASVECVERGLDPFSTNLVVANPNHGNTAICLAITPAMKKLGIKNRCRIYDIPKGIDYIVAMPRMKHYMNYSAKIYSIYLKYISPEDIHVYSIDECFIDLTPYIMTYKKNPKELANMLMESVFNETGICATAGVGTNLFLAKVALDVLAKHMPDNIGYLDESEFKRTMWHHKPITDIWNIGRGIATRLAKYGIYDLYGVAHCDDKLLYKEFGINAQYLIDHSHGIEPCTIREIHEYVPKSSSVTSGQVLPRNYSFDEVKIILREMTDLLALELVQRNETASSVSVYIGYASRALKATGGTRRLSFCSSSFRRLSSETERLYTETAYRNEPIRRINISFGGLKKCEYRQIDLLSDYEHEEREYNLQKTMAELKIRFGKNSVIRGMSLQDSATARQRNGLVGGHNGE